MTELLYRTEVTVSPGGGPNKLVSLGDGQEPVVMGARGPLADFMGVDTAQHGAHPSTLDYLVAATAACLTGTFGRTLAARGIAVTPETLGAQASGDVAVDGEVPVLRRIHVTYTLAADPEQRDAAQRAHDVHRRRCAVSRSIEGGIEVSTELRLA